MYEPCLSCLSCNPETWKQQVFLNRGFPQINSIDDILPHIQGREEFSIYDRDPFLIAEYTCCFPKTFPDPACCTESWKILRECRGMIFEKATGKLVSRPYHKFFNYGEKSESSQLKLADLADCYLLEKLDGSMIRPLFVNGHWRLATRGGISDVARQAEVYLEQVKLKIPYLQFFDAAAASNHTPLFEWIAPQNRIVVAYEKPQLVLTALRDINTGIYMQYWDMITLAEAFGIPYVKPVMALEDNITNLEELAKTVRAWPNQQEGMVIRFPSGEMLKLKSEDYMQMSRAKDLIRHECDVLDIFFKGNIDDLYGLLIPLDQERLRNYLNTLSEGMKRSAATFKSLTELGEPLVLDKTRYAKEFVNGLKKEWQHIMFAWRKYRETEADGSFYDEGFHYRWLMDWLERTLRKHRNKETVESTRWLHGAKW